MKNNTIFEKFYRTLSYYIVTGFLVKTKITPNQITALRCLVLFAGFISFSNFNIYTYCFGFFTLFLWDLLDCVDGDLATYKKMKSKYGQFIEEVFDFSIGRFAGPLAFAVTISYINIYPKDWLWVMIVLGFLIFSDRFFSLSIELKNNIFNLTTFRLEKSSKLSIEYAFGRHIHRLFLYYELQLASILLLLSALFGLSFLLPYILLLFASVYFILGLGVFIFVSRKHD